MSEASPATKTLAVFLGCISIFAMCGVVFGMPALYPSLYYRGFYANLCTDSDQCLQADTRGKCCEAQFVRIGLTSSTTFFIADAAAGFWGEYVDRAGAWSCFSHASSGCIGGFILLGFSLWPSPVLSYLRDFTATTAFAILGLSGPGVFNGVYVGCLSIVGSSSAHVSAFTAFSAACFDGSALVFALHHLFGVHMRLGLVTMIMVWALLGMGLRALFLRLLSAEPGHASAGTELPAGSTPKPKPCSDASPLKAASESSGLLADAAPPALPMPPDPDDAPAYNKAAAGGGASAGGVGGVGGLLVGLPASIRAFCAPRLVSTLLNRVNLAMISLMVSLNLVAAFYLQTQTEQMNLIFSSEESNVLGEFLEFGFPTVGFISSILAAKFVFEPNHAHELLCWVWPAGLGAAFCLVQSVPLLSFQYMAAFIFGPMRTMQWACYFHALAVAPRYPQALSGRVLGYNNVVIALLSDTLPFFLTALTAGDDSTTTSEQAWRYAFVRICLLLPVIATSALLAHELRRSATT